MKLDFSNNPKILNNFLNYLQVVYNYSENTIKAYNSDLMQFFKFIKDILEIPVSVKEFNIFILLKVRKMDIIAFLIHINFTNNNSPYTRQRKLSAIRSFYKWLLSTYPIGYSKENPARWIPNIEKVERVPRYLNLEQAKRIQEVFTLENCKFPLRNNAIISLFLNSGMRAGELININLSDINFSQNSILVRGKGNKERTVYFSNSCKDKLLKYIAYRNRKQAVVKMHEPLFISYQNKRVGIDCIEDICQKAYELIGVGDRGYTTHTLRHTTASLIYIYVKQDILLLKEILGHVNISTTEIYTHVYNEKVKDAVNKNPLNDYVKETRSKKIA